MLFFLWNTQWAFPLIRLDNGYSKQLRSIELIMRNKSTRFKFKYIYPLFTHEINLCYMSIILASFVHPVCIFVHLLVRVLGLTSFAKLDIVINQHQKLNCFFFCCYSSILSVMIKEVISSSILCRTAFNKMEFLECCTFVNMSRIHNVVCMK